MSIPFADAAASRSASAGLSTPKKHAKPIYPPKRNLYLTFQGKGRGWQDAFAVLCGDNPPTPTSGFAKWTTVDRPLLRGLTVFTGYDPVTLNVEVRFGVWTSTWEWLVDDASGQQVETDMHKLMTMGGMFQGAGQSPYVYLNSYDSSGRTTPLIPLTMQQTSGVTGKLANANTWPWVVTGLQWGEATKNPGGYTVRRDCTVTLLNYQGLSTPQTSTVRGGYFTSAPGRDTMLLIAEDHNPNGAALRPDLLANQIKTSPRNNPCRGSRVSLERKSVRWVIPHRTRVWVPGHQV